MAVYRTFKGIKDFKGVWIPKEIWLNEDLSLQEKVVLIEIDSLEDDIKGCYASNNYFASFFKLSPGRISQIINNLANKEYIDIKYMREGKEIIERQIRIKRPPYPLFNKLNTYLENEDRGIKKTKEGYLENDKENHIYSNNINNINDDNIIDFLQNNGFFLTPIQYDFVKEWEDTELTRYAIKRAVLNGKYNIAYIQAILNSYEKNNIRTIQQAMEQDQKFNKKTNKEENVPEWFDQEQEINIEEKDKKELEDLLNELGG